MFRAQNLRYTIYVLAQCQRKTSSSTTAAHPDKSCDGTTHPAENGQISETKSKRQLDVTNKSQLVAAAFSTLKHNEKNSLKPKSILDQKILQATTPEVLLGLSQTSMLSKQQALRIVTTLTEWSVNGQADMTQFESDPRFVSLCQMLGRASTPTASQMSTKHGDLSVVLGVTGDDEAAKLVSTITLPQMIKVLSSLAYKKRRSIPLLRSLAFNIARSPIKLGIKEGGDILYSLSVLNFPDEVLLEKVSSDISESIVKCNKSSVIGSISTSFGMLRYKDTVLLDTLADWVVDHKKDCRCQDVLSLLLTLATVNHTPANGEKFFETAITVLTSRDLPSNVAWLDFVWSLSVFNQAKFEHFTSVLTSQFIEKISLSHSRDINFSWKKKLLNINGVAKYSSKGYTGPLLEDSSFSIPLLRSKEKQHMVSSVMDALSNLLPSSVFLRMNIDIGMGFILDGECLIDTKMVPLPLVDKTTGLPLPNHGKGIKVAIMVWDYHDNTRGSVTLNGFSALSIKLLNCLGYRVLSVPHTEYNIRDKLTNRVQYLENQLKHIAKSSS